jgi:hypothetical protein
MAPAKRLHHRDPDAERAEFFDRRIQASWFKVDRIVAVVAEFLPPLHTFRSRLVHPCWAKVVEELEEPYWRDLCLDLHRGARTAHRILCERVPAYRALRQFSRADVTNVMLAKRGSASGPGVIPNLLIQDCQNMTVLRWYCNVPTTVAFRQVLFDIDCIRPVAMGLPIQRDRAICEHKWPCRGGRSGWELDLLVWVTTEDPVLMTTVPSPVPFDVLISRRTESTDPVESVCERDLSFVVQ